MRFPAVNGSALDAARLVTPKALEEIQKGKRPKSLFSIALECDCRAASCKLRSAAWQAMLASWAACQSL